MSVVTGRLKILAATASIIVLAEIAVPVQAGGLTGVVGGVTGTVGGVVGGVTDTTGGVVGGVTGTVGGVTGSVGGIAGGTTGGVVGGVTNGPASQGLASSDTTSSKHGVFGSTPLSHKALLKLKAKVLGIKAGVYVLDSYGNLVRINARIADHILKAKANVYVLQHGSLVKIYAKAALADLNAKAKIYVLDNHGHVLHGKAFVSLGNLKAKAYVKVLDKHGKILAANVRVGLGGPVRLKAKAGANVGTSGANVRVSLLLGLNGRHHPGPGGGPGSGTGGDDGDNGNNGNNGNNGGTNAGISREIAALSNSERRELKRKCPAVLSSPASYTADAVRVCRVISQLAGL
jgi:hypothetical protein